ncbi:LLM class flavin-dependent oxidoreductase [Georgenia faecalis]|uniref:LLM class flavin-dependent oxidoreductase n=1 Tax=Georgenia faecalis TaxID=2483799 RepID=A0ABV9D7M6_9MICO|nr:LLM class flavin-dependent oxidoreductase [Georgenia faecalis]
MRLGIVLLPQLRWRDAAPRWRRAEEMGFDHAWTYDHLAWRDLADEPWYATVPTLTAAAAVTETITLGTWVASPNFRHPVPFAKELLTLDDISDGRFLLGVGAGGLGWDADVLGHERLSPGERVARLAEFVELLDALLTGERTTWSGEHYRAVDARMIPGCVQTPRVPFVVAANGPRAMAVAARIGQGWATTGPETDDEEAWWRGVRETVSRLDDVAAAHGRTDLDRYLSLDTSAYSLSSVDHFEEMVGRARELGFTDVVAHWPRESGVYAGDERVLEEAASRLPHLR